MNRTRTPHDKGLRRLIRQGRELFRIRENTQYYSVEDYREAEKKFIKVCILEGRCGSFSS
jgi:hypothetical protein